MINLAQHLNPSQLEAVTTLDGPVLVIAGAGSGKTRVIEFRVLNLVHHGVNPNSILLLTFTRKASREMLSRAARHDPRCQNVEGGTFHSFALKTLKKYARAIGFTDAFTVLDEGDAEEAIHRCATKLGLFNKERRFPRKDTLRNVISISINKGVSIEEVLRTEYTHFLEFSQEIEKLRTEYASYKLKKEYLDYDDLLVYLKILLENDEVRRRLGQKYRYIMVDEYQDTNALQGDITFALASEHNNVMVVGDDAQSIYGFRGASHENIMQFPSRFSECKIVKLEQNYRSTQAVLDVANSILENMKNKYSKCLVAARNEHGTKPNLLFFKDAYEEAEWIASAVKQVRDEGTPLGQIAVLFRSAYLSIPLQAELGKRNIPYQLFGGLKFYETAHVKDITAHLKILSNPRDELAWNRVLMLIDGIGPRTAERFAERIVAASSFNEITGKILRQTDKRFRGTDGLGRLADALQSASNASFETGDRYDVMLEYYRPLLQNKYDDWHLRANDLETLRQIAIRYASLEELLTDFAIEPPERGVFKVDPSTPDEEKPLTLSTIHSAKGLEWDSVFIMGMIDGVLPVSFAMNSEDEIEEERRLFYVAVTRAKTNLFLTLHHEGFRGGITQFNKLSRFVDSDNVLQKLEQRDVFQLDLDAQTNDVDAEDISRVFEKDDLLAKIIKSYR